MLLFWKISHLQRRARFYRRLKYFALRSAHFKPHTHTHIHMSVCGIIIKRLFMEFESNHSISAESYHKHAAFSIDRRGKARIMPRRLRESLSVHSKVHWNKNKQPTTKRCKSSSAAAALYEIHVSVEFYLDLAALARNVNKAIKSKVKVITSISMSSPACKCVLCHSFFIQFI